MCKGDIDARMKFRTSITQLIVKLFNETFTAKSVKILRQTQLNTGVVPLMS